MYDITPINMTEGAGNHAPTTVTTNIPQNDPDVKTQFSLSASEAVKEAEEYFGTTYKINEAGLLTAPVTSIRNDLSSPEEYDYATEETVEAELQEDGSGPAAPNGEQAAVSDPALNAAMDCARSLLSDI